MRPWRRLLQGMRNISNESLYMLRHLKKLFFVRQIRLLCLKCLLNFEHLTSLLHETRRWGDVLQDEELGIPGRKKHVDKMSNAILYFALLLLESARKEMSRTQPALVVNYVMGGRQAVENIADTPTM